MILSAARQVYGAGVASLTGEFTKWNLRCQALPIRINPRPLPGVVPGTSLPLLAWDRATHKLGQGIGFNVLIPNFLTSRSIQAVRVTVHAGNTTLYRTLPYW